VANETLDDQEVFFDDLKITHESATANFKVSQVNDYYPFGMLTSNTWRDAGYVDPGYLYQSSYASYDSLTGYYDFLSRSYDPALGRFFAMDPAGQFSTPYGAMGNVPHMMVDPNGELAFMAIMGVLAKAAKIYGMASTAVNVSKGFSEGGWKGGLQAIGSAAIGYGAGALGGSIIGGLDIKGALPGAVAGAAIQGTISGGITHLAGGDFWNGFKGGAISGGIQGGVTGVINAHNKYRNPITGMFDSKSIDRYKNSKLYQESISTKFPIVNTTKTNNLDPTLIKGGIKRPLFIEGEYISSNATLLNEVEVLGKKTYLDNAMKYIGAKYKLGKESSSEMDCSGLVCLATGYGKNHENRWYTWSGEPPGEWKKVKYNTTSIKSFVKDAKRGDLFVWPGKHTVFSQGGEWILHARASRGVGSWPDLKWWLKNHGYPKVYRQIVNRLN